MKTVAVPTIKRADLDTTKTSSRAGVSTVHVAQERIGLIKPYMRPVYAGGTHNVADSQQMEFPIWSRAISKRRSKNQPRDDYLQKSGTSLCGGTIMWQFVDENAPPDCNMIIPRPA